MFYKRTVIVEPSFNGLRPLVSTTLFVTLTKTLYFNIFPGLQFDDIYTSCLFWDWLTIYRVKSLPRRHINPFSWWILITDACFNSSSAFFRGVVGGTNNMLARHVSVAKWRDHPLRSVNLALCLLWLFRLFLSIFLLFHLYIFLARIRALCDWAS